MSIQIVCECGQSYKVRDQLAGKRVRCKQCSQVIPIPSTAIARAEPHELPNRHANPATDPEYLRQKRIEYASASVSHSSSGTITRLIRSVEKHLPFPIIPQRVPYSVRVAGGTAPAVQLTSEGIRDLILSRDVNLSTEVSHPDWKNESAPGEPVWKTLRDIVTEDYRIEVLYRPLLAHIRRGARWLAIAVGIIMFPAILILVLMHTLLSCTEDDSLLRGAAMLLFAPFFLPLLLYVALALGTGAVSGALYGGMIGLVRVTFLPRAPESFKPA